MKQKMMILCMAAVGATTVLHAQTRDKGTLTGSLESNSIYYVDDSELGAAAANPDDHFGSNNYLKLDYTRGKFSAGIQLEGFCRHYKAMTTVLMEMDAVRFLVQNMLLGKMEILDFV